MTTSNINYAAINENFPVAGQDNDTQVFRDNFDTIKTNFLAAKTEIQDLLDNSARTDQTNDFNKNIISRAKLLNNEDVAYNYQTQPAEVVTLGIDYENGIYQIVKITGTPFTFTFLNFPKAGNSVGKVRVELYGASTSSRTVNFSLSGSGATEVKSLGFPGYPSGIPQITLTSSTTAVIFDVWRHTESTFFMQYIGSFS